MAQPIVADGKLFAMDAGSTVSARDAGGGGETWRVDLTPDEERDGLFGGGLAYDEDRLFVTTPFGLVFALDPNSGAELWRSQVAGADAHAADGQRRPGFCRHRRQSAVRPRGR